MDTSDVNSLLALLLALKQLEVPLNLDEQSDLAEVGQQLAIDPDDWEFIQEGLMAIIEGNAALNQLYQTAKAQLDAVGGEIPLDLLPTEAELQRTLTDEKNRSVVKKGIDNPPGKPERKSHELSNITRVIDTAVIVLTNEDSSKTSKNLLQRFSSLLKQPINRRSQNP